MANELEAQSSSRQGVEVLWLCIHSAEGPTDEFPADPASDAGSARDLVQFGQTKTDRSWHACADDDVLIDDLVPYDRAAWTLRSGNIRSDNLELCGLASWSREQWLKHPGMLHNAAVWVVRRMGARRWSDSWARHLVVDELRTQVGHGVIGHVDYTIATGDGTHTDPGPWFPWDVLLTNVRKILNPITEADMFEAVDRNTLKHINAVLSENNIAGKVNALSDAVPALAADVDSVVTAVADIRVQVAEILAELRAEPKPTA